MAETATPTPEVDLSVLPEGVTISHVDEAGVTHFDGVEIEKEA